MENLRLDVLESYRETYTVEDRDLIQLCQIAARLSAAPIVAVSWIGRDEQWFQVAYGSSIVRMPRNAAPCAQVVESGLPLEIPDVMSSLEWRRSVLNDMGVGSYHGYPMRNHAGFLLGTFVVLDTHARSLTPFQRESILGLCELVVSRIEAVNEIQQLRHELKSSESLAQLGLVAGGLIHEIASPLTALLHRSSAARASYEEGRSDVGTQLVRQEGIAKRIIKIVAAVRGFAECPENVTKENLRMVDLVDQFMFAVQADLQTNKVSMYLEIPPELEIRVNAAMFVQILVNLFNNAVHAMEPVAERYIEIGAVPSEKSGFIRIQFRDSGPGVDESVRARIDQAFVSSKKGSGGLGLGLTICQRFAQQMGGSLKLDPDRERTMFVLEVPAAT